MSGFGPTNYEEWMRAQTKQAIVLDRRGRGADLGYAGSMRTAILDDFYRGPGPASVIFDGYETVVGPFEWLSPYVPNGSRLVTMLKAEGTWLIMGQQQGDRHALALGSNWTTYVEKTAWYGWREGFSERLPSGIVVLGGLLSARGVPTAGQTITQLPPGQWPETRILRPVNQSDDPRTVYIEPDGRVCVGSSGWSAGYVSLDGIAFPAAGVADWQAIGSLPGTGLANGWVSAGGVWGDPRLWLDPYGFVWFEGVIQGGNVTANTVVTALPAGYGSYRMHHMATTSNNAYGILGTDATNQNLVIRPTTSNVLLGLGGILLVTAQARASNPWHDVEGWGGGWSPYGSPTHTIPSRLRRGDGLCVLSGIITGGTMIESAFTNDAELSPREKIIMQTASNTARGRLDIWGENSVQGENVQRRTVPVNGINAWFSLDTKVWAAA